MKQWRRRIWYWLKGQLGSPSFYGLCLFLGTGIFLVVSLIKTHLFDLSIGIALIMLYGLILSAAYYFSNLSTKRPMRWVMALICVLIGLLSVFGGRLCALTETSIEKVAHPDQPVDQIWNIYCYSQAPVNDLAAMSDSEIGVLESRMSEAQKVLDEENIQLSLRPYKTLNALYKGLKGQAVRALMMEESSLEMLTEAFDHSEAASKLSLVETLPVSSGGVVAGSDLDTAKDPFTVLIDFTQASVDSQSFKTDLLCLVTVNPVTRQLLTTWIPRNMEAQIACPEGMRCPVGETDKVSAISYYSIAALAQTVSQTLDVPVDFTIQADLDGLLKLADLNSGLPVQNAEAFSVGTRNFKEGDLLLTTSQAASYSSGRDGFSHQDALLETKARDVVLQLADLMKIGSFSKLNEHVEILTENLNTSMTYAQLSDLIRLMFFHPTGWTTYTQTVKTDEEHTASAILQTTVYMEKAKDDSLARVSAAINAVLNGQTPPDSLDEIDNPNTNAQNSSDESDKDALPDGSDPAGLSDPDSQTSDNQETSGSKDSESVDMEDQNPGGDDLIYEEESGNYGYDFSEDE